jgi:hypothetical protein
MRDAHTQSAITLLPTKVLQLPGESKPTTQLLLIEWLWRELRLAVTAQRGRALWCCNTMNIEGAKGVAVVCLPYYLLPSI